MAEERRVYEPNVDSVRDARRFIGAQVGEAGGDADAAALMVSELAANAVLHAGSRYEVRVRRNGTSVRVEVVNDRPEMIARLVAASDESGRGLAIVNELARAWGVETGDGRETVWFELPLGGA
jgi:anti-sigma regulatory factor (Ser/Thr protein kinase)